MQINKVQF